MNFVTKKSLDRRALLRGSCAALALPALSSMTAALTRPAPTPLRLVFLYLPNGVIGDAWQVEQPGPLGSLPSSWRSLQPLARDLTFLSGLAQDKGRANGDGPGDHARAAGSWLTACQPFKGDGTRIRVGVSADQVAARQLGAFTRIPSLVLGSESGRLSGQCDSGYPCSYSNTISWSTPHTPLPKLTDPGRLFDQLVGDVRPGESAQDRKRRLRQRASVLDLVQEDAKRLQQSLGQEDRVKLEEYLSAVRSTEGRLQRFEAQGQNVLGNRVRPEEKPREHAERSALLFDLLALALESDTTRVATLMLANEGSNRSYPLIGVNEGHHSLSHHKGDEKKIRSLRKINQHHIDLIAPFLLRLARSKDNAASILNSSAVVIGSGLSDGNRHRHGNLPLVIAGQLADRIQSGQHIQSAPDTPMANLLLSLLNGARVHADRLGDSTGRVDLLGSL